MAEILPFLTAPGLRLITTGDSAQEGLYHKSCFRQGEEQGPSATFHSSYTTAVQF